jgi:hypothetical protein
MEENKNNEVEELEELPVVGEGEEDFTDYKELATKFQGMAKRFQTKIKKLAEEAEKPKPETKEKPAEVVEKKEGLDRIDRAVLRTEKIVSEDEVKLVEDIMKETGKSVEQVLESKYFITELKELRDAKTTSDAVPKGINRSTQSARDSVDYWVAKGELPPRDQVELRRKVVEAKMQMEKSKSQFSDNPIV